MYNLKIIEQIKEYANILLFFNLMKNYMKKHAFKVWLQKYEYIHSLVKFSLLSFWVRRWRQFISLGVACVQCYLLFFWPSFSSVCCPPKIYLRCKLLKQWNKTFLYTNSKYLNTDIYFNSIYKWIKKEKCSHLHQQSQNNKIFG